MAKEVARPPLYVRGPDADNRVWLVIDSHLKAAKNLGEPWRTSAKLALELRDDPAALARAFGFEGQLPDEMCR
ncbi:MAG TPA: hypothetical protein VNT77_04945 [Allosphingosinicella sp.]|nr:hypothetical protein [Allosphingosinicella sp.]